MPHYKNGYTTSETANKDLVIKDGSAGQTKATIEENNFEAETA
jgi:hypothetical protein